uniref:PUM-HD domain-containing protein n=1 Tax=Kalanchoe fedtschenkoi TaxID=63787 RepID=A0A7N0TPK0_KALFE
MERKQLGEGFGGHRQQWLDSSGGGGGGHDWTMRGQLTSQGLGFPDDRGFEDLFAQLDLAGEAGNNPGSSPRLGNGFLMGGVENSAFVVGGESNLVPRLGGGGDGVYGLGPGSVNNGANAGLNGYHHLLYKNGYYNPVGSSFGSTVRGGLLETYRFYQAELQRAQMAEFYRRSSGAGRGRLPGELGLPASPFSSRNEFGADLAARQVRGRNRSFVASYSNASGAGLSPGMGNRSLEQGVSEVNLMDLRGQIMALATDQYGCKLLQVKFGDIKEEEVEMILEEVIDKVAGLMMDQFGNYLVQKLIEVCSEEQRTRIVHSVTKNPYQLISVSLNLHGTRAVQRLLENLNNEHQISMVISALSPGVVTLIKDGNGYHVIQHCLKHFPDEHNRFLVHEIARNCYEIATDKSGCCVLQLCVDITQGEIKEHLITELIANALPLSEDRYGNYVVQHLLLMKVPNITASLVNELRGHFFTLACNKYGSNVVEKCLTETGEEYSNLVILELLKTPGVSKLLQDPYGNYVFQSALSVSQGMLHNALVSLVEKYSSSMCSNLYGKKVLAWFDNRKRLAHMYGNLRP